jgi:hypothetical protein
MRPSFFARFGDSIRGRITLSIMVVLLMMLIPAIASVSMMTSYARQYHDVITRMDRISSLSPVINDDLLGEMWSIVAGRVTFAKGNHFASWTPCAMRWTGDRGGFRQPAADDRRPAHDEHAAQIH